MKIKYIERLEGWWFRHIVEALCSETPVFIAQNQVRDFIVLTSQEYADDNLPIDDFDNYSIDLELEDKIFCKQLKLICVSNSRLKIALKDYYRAFNQRANWIRNDLLYIDELDRYEQRLIDEWEHSFVAMEDELNEDSTEDGISKEGRKLLKSIEEKDIRIRPKCSRAFVMRGSYHLLANELKVGWHRDFFGQLKHLLKGNESEENK